MVTEITAGIEVSVETMYQEGHSVPDQHIYVFAYKILIANHNPHTVQLLRRKWVITNGIGEVEIVQGDGIVGRQPILYQGDKHEYVSGCHLVTPVGRMEGWYYFENKIDASVFEVRIPAFKLEAPFVLN